MKPIILDGPALLKGPLRRYLGEHYRLDEGVERQVKVREYPVLAAFLAHRRFLHSVLCDACKIPPIEAVALITAAERPKHLIRPRQAATWFQEREPALRRQHPHSIHLDAMISVYARVGDVFADLAAALADTPPEAIREAVSIFFDHEELEVLAFEAAA